jgi:hypothetical protein
VEAMTYRGLRREVEWMLVRRHFTAVFSTKVLVL